MKIENFKLKIHQYLGWFIVSIAIGLNLYLYYPESQIAADPNDNVFQFSLVARTDWVWKTYGCPLTLSCIPNLIDHLVPTWAEGYPLPFYYSHIPQILIVSSYNLFISPFCSLLTTHCSLFSYYHWITYLLLCFFPLPVFLALRIVGFSPILAAFGGLFAVHVSTDGLYGIDPPSFLWRGYGLTSQLYAMMWMPLAIAFVYRAMANSKFKIQSSKLQSKIQNGSQKTLKEANSEPGLMSGGSELQMPRHYAAEKRDHNRLGVVENFVSEGSGVMRNSILGMLFITLTTAGHLGMGILTIFSTWPFLFVDFKPRWILQRVKLLALIVGCSIFLLSYWIIPILLANNYHIISFWDPIWKFDSYGAYEVIRQFFAGELFDWGRYPYITVLIAIGWFAAALSPRFFPFAILFAFWFLMYFGRTSWGGLIDLIPGMKDFHQHRFLVGVQIAGLFLLPLGLEWLYQAIINIKYQISNMQFKIGKRETPRHYAAESGNHQRLGVVENFVSEGFIVPGVFFTLIVILLFFTIQQTVRYNSLNSKWIYEARDAFRYGQKDFDQLVTHLQRQPSARIYAGRPGNWGKQQRIGSSELYMQLGIYGLDISQFLPETWSPLSENDQNFDERLLPDYDLLNISSIVTDSNHEFPAQASLTKTYGSFQVYDVPTRGWFDVVSSPMLITSDKTNFINIVHFWHRSFPRTWKMYPLISVEKNPATPFPVEKQVHMVDEVTYKEVPGANDQRLVTNDHKNIFADFPFVFPQATVSATLVSESVDKQIYRGTVEVPDPCPSCMIMFKMSYHPNWKVTVDGKPAEKYAVFPFYLATPATPGRHTVEWTYKPNSLKIVLLIGELIILAAIVVATRRGILWRSGS